MVNKNRNLKKQSHSRYSLKKGKRPVETDLLGGKEIILLENNYIVHSSCEKYMCNL